MEKCSKELFMSDVARHQMEILRDDGEANRHVRFKRPGESAYYFDLITWPGCLCITGDMGTYVFSRLRDMFEFFRTDRKHRPDDPLPINKSYWSEKLIACDCNGRNVGSSTRFDPDKFRQVINEYRTSWMRQMRDEGIEKDERRELWESVDNDVLCYGDDEHRSMAAAYDFHGRSGHLEFSFDDIFEHSFQRYTFHFEWICYALSWGIQQYDVAKSDSIPA